jgi:hypothetical protein
MPAFTEIKTDLWLGYSQMEFYREPGDLVTISRGDILLTLDKNPTVVYITVTLMRRDYVCFNATDRLHGDFSYVRETDGHVCFNIDNGNTISLLNNLLSSKRNNWRRVPQMIASEIAVEVDTHIY